MDMDTRLAVSLDYVIWDINNYNKLSQAFQKIDLTVFWSFLHAWCFYVPESIIKKYISIPMENPTILPKIISSRPFDFLCLIPN